ncbi:MAG: glycoside hydrolase family 88 protein [Clostridiales bacterium]|jgi:unsaturated rhamnogalacturonyl hydrolase|nr:glycoside hydrolase family 88 protein [Clostridiales bacterium]
MVRLSFDENQVLTLIDRMVKKTVQMDLTWDWPCGVAYYGLTQAYKATGKDEYINLLKARVDEHIELGVSPAVPWNVNACAMGHCLIDLYEATDDETYWNLALSKTEYLRTKALRFADGVLQHTVSSKNDFPEQAWSDTLFMAAFFLLRMGVKMNDRAVIDDALNQYYYHIEYLQDPASGLWFHGYDNIHKDHMSGFFWARANAWAAYTMSRVGRTLPEPYLYPRYMDVDSSLRDQLAGLKPLQTEGGLWRTVLDDAESYEELSASAGITAAMLTRGNPLDSKAAQKAFDGLLANITEDGRLLNVSGGTAVMRDLESYRAISRKWTQGWGQGLGLAALSAAVINAKAASLR